MDGLARGWLEAVGTPEIAAELEAIYAKAAAAIAERRPICVQSGRCCHFERAGHRLYVTGVEAAYTVSKSTGSQSRTGGTGGSTDWSAEPDKSVARISLPVIGEARGRGTCPYLEGSVCTVHGVKPLACRTYFCDPSARGWSEELTERLLGEIRALHERHSIEYRYGEWRGMLELVVRP